MDKKHMNEQANLAFDFLDKLNLETSYLIKEIEGILRKEEENFVIGKVGGYAVTGPNSLSLDSPEEWISKRVSVFFIPKKDELKGDKGKTETPIKKGLKVIFLMIVFQDKNHQNPVIIMGTFYDITSNSEHVKKFENLISDLTWFKDKVFSTNSEKVDYNEPKWCSLKGKFIVKDLFEINGTEDVNKLVKQVLDQYRSIK